MACICWLLAALISIPMLFMFHTTYITDPGSIFYNQTVCESLFRYRPISHRQAFLTFMAIMHVFLPCIAICTCYLRIYLKIAQKVKEATSSVMSLKPGKVHLQSTSSTLPKAKIKTLKMTVVIVTVFLLCGLPYHVMELLFNFWKHDYVPKVVIAIMGALPVANSVVNPYIFIFFNVTCRSWKGVMHQNVRQSYIESKTEHTMTTNDDDITIVKYETQNSIDSKYSHNKEKTNRANTSYTALKQ